MRPDGSERRSAPVRPAPTARHTIRTFAGGYEVAGSPEPRHQRGHGPGRGRREERDTARSDEEPEHDEADPEEDLALEELNDSGDDENDCDDPQDECHAGPLPGGAIPEPSLIGAGDAIAGPGHGSRAVERGRDVLRGRPRSRRTATKKRMKKQFRDARRRLNLAWLADEGGPAATGGGMGIGVGARWRVGGPRALWAKIVLYTDGDMHRELDVRFNHPRDGP